MSDHTTDTDNTKQTRERINTLLRTTAVVTEKSLSGFTDAAKLERLKKKQVGLMMLLRYFESDPAICAEEIVKYSKAPFTVCQTAYDVEKETLNTYKQMLGIIWNGEIKDSRNISLIVEKINEATSIFHVFAHTRLEDIQTFTMTRDAFVEKCTGHIAEVLSSSFNAVSNPTSFKMLSINEIKDIQESFDYFNRFNAMNEILKNVFLRVTPDESFMFPLLQKIYHLNDFLKGYLHFQMAIDPKTNEDNATRGKNLRLAVSLFEEGESPLLSERTLSFLNMTEQDVRQFAATIGVTTPPFHRQIDLFPRPRIG